MEVAGKVVVVTGGGSGIGAALVRESIARGVSRVGVVDIDGERAGALAQELERTKTRVAAFTCDVSSYVEVAALAHDVVDRLGPPGLVCSNAGVNGAGGPVVRLKPADVEWVLSVNLRGVWNCCSVFGQMLWSAGDGWLLNTGSEHSLGVPHLGLGMYTATKHAVLGMSDVMRRELAPRVGVSVLCPGRVSTQIWNSGRLRPEHLGGPIEMTEESALLMERGIDPGSSLVSHSMASRTKRSSSRHTRTPLPTPRSAAPKSETPSTTSMRSASTSNRWTSPR